MTRDEQWVLEEKYAGGADAPGFSHDCARLAQGEPVAYIIGWQPFLGLKIVLDSKPLIPRPETEWWTHEMLEEFGGGCRALDLCAGSGAIGCVMLAVLPEAEVYFGEIDPAHEATIRKNIRENGLDGARTHIGIGDLFVPFPSMKFDLIACNPPYIPSGRELPASVAGYEPSLALRAGVDGLDLTRRIAEELPNHLAERGVAWVECDSPSAETASGLFSQEGFTTRLMHDQYGAPRVIVVSFP